MENEEWSAECAERAENGEWRTGVESGEWRWRVASGDREWSVYIMFSPCCLLRDALNLRELRGMCVHFVGSHQARFLGSVLKGSCIVS